MSKFTFNAQDYVRNRPAAKVMPEIRAVFKGDTINIQSERLLRMIKEENLREYFTEQVLKRDIAFLTQNMGAMKPALVKMFDKSRKLEVERIFNLCAHILERERANLMKRPHFGKNPLADMIFEYSKHYVNLYSSDSSTKQQAQALTSEIPERMKEIIGALSVRADIEKQIWRFRERFNSEGGTMTLLQALQNYEHQVILGLFDNILEFGIPDLLLYAPTKADEVKVMLAQKMEYIKSSKSNLVFNIQNKRAVRRRKSAEKKKERKSKKAKKKAEKQAKKAKKPKKAKKGKKTARKNATEADG